jgi:hypothetical protein
MSSADQAKRGRFLGGTRPPFGWRIEADGKGLVENPAEQAAIATMRQLRAEGASFQMIADAVTETHGIPMDRFVARRALKRLEQPQ